MNSRKDKLTKISSKGVCFLHWSGYGDSFYVLRNSENLVVVEQYDAQRLNLEQRFEIDFGKKVSVFDFKDYPNFGFFGICVSERVCVFNFQGEKIREFESKEVIVSFEAKDADTLLLKQSYIQLRSLIVWNLVDNSTKLFELESLGHYNWSYKIDPSFTLLYGTFNAYECGACAHVLDFSKDRLEVISQENLYSHRAEINCSSLSMNSLGDEYAYIADDDGSAYTLCHQSVYQGRALNEIKLPVEPRFFMTRFLLDRYIAIWSAKSVLIIDPWDRSYKPGKKAGIEISVDVETPVAFDNIGGRILYMDWGSLRMFRLDEEPQTFDTSRKDRIASFREDARNGKFELTPVDMFRPKEWYG